MDMRMVNRLSGNFAAIHTNVKPLHRNRSCDNLCPSFVQQLIDRPSLGLEQIEEAGNVTLRYD